MSFDELIKSFQVQPDLNRYIWDESDQLDPKVRKGLLRIAESFYNSLDLKDKPPIKDIVFTGSLANYNWSRFSDVDLHLLFDFEKYGDHQNTFENLFLLAKSNWNNKHDVFVKGFEVEVYAEDQNNPHVATGVYSVLHDKWIKKPKKETPVFDPLDVKTKAIYIAKLVNQLLDQRKEITADKLLPKVEYLQNKIKRFRQSGLNNGGEFSTENLAFKALRRAKVLDKLYDLKTKLTDRNLSISERKK